MKKKVELSSKLALNRETIARLNEQQLKAIAGGGTMNTWSCNGNAVAQESDEDLEIDSCCATSCTDISQSQNA